ncbi:unnamed protein product [Caenorhabditis bovis]|uniref:Chromo domain-containing protein n=1 Tax=Caenorhabditis bovis TaxID=2654633 RepID=A0A8S1EQJ7_9PELO|nr:unnamed protein product [Caenorhabditis bovis]
MEPLDDDGVFAVEELLKSRKVKGKLQYLVKWQGWSSKHNTWEPAENVLDHRLVEAFEAKQKATAKKRGSSGSKKSDTTPVATPTKKRRLAGGEVRSESSDSSDHEEPPTTSRSRRAPRRSKEEGMTVEAEEKQEEEKKETELDEVSKEPEDEEEEEEKKEEDGKKKEEGNESDEKDGNEAGTSMSAPGEQHQVMYGKIVMEGDQEIMELMVMELEEKEEENLEDQNLEVEELDEEILRMDTLPAMKRNEKDRIIFKHDWDQATGDFVRLLSNSTVHEVKFDGELVEIIEL